MFQFVGYSFFSDQNALNQAPANVDSITATKISNAIFDHFNVTQNTSLPVSTTLPTVWDYDTIMDADFNGNLSAGNVDFLIEEISAIKIKRRVQGTFNWMTLKTVSINTLDDLTFVFNDLLNAYGVEYDYAFVPIFGNDSSPGGTVEGNYIINSILSKFNGVFIGDAENIYKFFYDVQYGTHTVNQQIGTFQPFGNQYPVIVANGILSYESGTVSATILNNDFESTGLVNPTLISQQKNNLIEYLTNKKAKILKDWNGNIWLCIITSSPTITYKSGSGMRIPQIQFGWTEIGDASNSQALYNNGILSEVN